MSSNYILILKVEIHVRVVEKKELNLTLFRKKQLVFQ